VSPTWQAFNIYNLGQGTADFERLLIGWDNLNNSYLRTQKGGTGTSRNLYVGTEGASSLFLVTNGASRWFLDTSGHLAAAAAGVDVGNNTLTGDPRTVYARTSFIVTGNNGQTAGLKWKDELIAVPNGVTEVTSTITLPAKALLMAVQAYVQVALPNVTAFSACTDLDSGGTGARFGSAASGALGTTITGSIGCPYVDAGARNIKFLFTGTTNANTGRIRVAIQYLEATAITS
jgi:hypothetical protein